MNTQEKVEMKVAVIGSGWAGMRHAQAFARCGARVTWVVDVRLEKAETLKDSLGGLPRLTTDYREALIGPELQAVDICLPHDLHGVVAVAAARAGKHILCEKPIAANLEEADQMIVEAEAAGVVLMIAENERFLPISQRIHDLVSSGAIGKPALLQMTRECYLTESFTRDRPWFLNAKSAAGGMMMAGGVHDFETARFTLDDDVENVYALRAPQRFLELEGDDTSVALVRFRSGTVGTFVQSFIMKSLVTAAGLEVHTLRIDGDMGSLYVKDGHTIHLYSEADGWKRDEKLIQHDIYVPEEDTFYLEVKHFTNCSQTSDEPITSGRSQRRPLEFVLAVYRSMETGMPVCL